MAFGYFPDYKKSFKPADWYLGFFGYPYPSRRNETQEVLNMLGVDKNDLVLDIGSGDGIWTNYLASKNQVSVVGLDYSIVDLKKATSRAKAMKLVNTNRTCADACQMPFLTNVFDKAYSISTFEHIANDEMAFGEVARVLKPGGKFVVSVPNNKTLRIPRMLANLPVKYKKWLRKPIREANSSSQYQDKINEIFAHYRLYTENLLKMRAKKSGMKLNKVNYVISLFSLIPQTMYHTWSIFDWDKEVNTGYNFASMAIFPILFPFTNPFYVLDRWLNLPFGYILVAEMEKLPE